MGTHKGDPNHECRDKHRSNAREKDNHGAGHDKPEQGLPIRKLTAEDSKRWIGSGTKDIKKQPSGKKTSKDDERKWIRKEGDRKNSGDYSKVIDTEIGVVLADPLGGFGDGFRLGDGGSVNEF